MQNAKPCGCEQGGVGLLIGLACCALYFLVTGSWQAAGYTELWFILGFLVLITGIGKIIGIRIENHRQLQAERGPGTSNDDGKPNWQHSHSITQKFWTNDPSRCCGRK